MKFLVIYLFFIFSFTAENNRLDALTRVELSSTSSSLEGIGDILIINLDKRPEKYQNCLLECLKYNIEARRFPAIEGTLLDPNVVKNLAMVFLPHMKKGLIKISPLEGFIRKATSDDFNKPCFFYNFTPGALGCYLSHMSLMNYLLNSPHESIWVLEDDFVFLKDPRHISRVLEDLDRLVGCENWDILFTDDEHFFSFEGDYDFYRPDFVDILQDFLIDNFVKVQDFKSPANYASEVEKLEKAHLLKWANVNRKGFICSKYPDYFERFRRISGRFMIHSMIVKKSAAQKIINFYLKRGIFLPYDDELAFIPELRMYNLKIPITSHKEEISDTNR